jgi:putative spermidine/putrescine transport system ATP-binding protein
VAADRIAVALLDVHRHFGEVRAVDGVTLHIRDGEFFALLGPSGSGKTTCLRLVAGFDRPTAGRLELFGAPAGHLPPYERDVNTVFQDYALFPHMTVAENVAYGLTVRRVPRAERDERVAQALEMVRLPGVGARKPAALSGGQRQRVALARALVVRPRVLLLDEPLGALDLKLRQQMQVELKAIQERLGITFVHVTHDQEEALAMSNRLAVLNHGRVEQVGTPAEVYESPASAFVANFVGVSNLVEGRWAEALTGSPAPFTVRPEKVHLLEAGAEAPPGACTADGHIQDVVYLGPHTRYVVDVGGDAPFVVLEQNREQTSGDVQAARGRAVRLSWPRAANRPIGGGD